jgi:16S rRNA A1518/A1519 N6-dimethyltransferase RsmA/KsgA/DIM1 with predicted DNA glycosylase/AP lyase activity
MDLTKNVTNKPKKKHGSNTLPPSTKYNIAFYEAVTSRLTKRADFIGLSNCCDVKLILPFLNPKDTILEVGPGYGRVLSCLNSLDIKLNIHAIENSKKMTDLLLKKFQENITIINSDINAYSSNKKFNAILILWAGIQDFTNIQQKKLLKKLKTMLTPNGFLFIDNVPYNQNPHDSIYI